VDRAVAATTATGAGVVGCKESGLMGTSGGGGPSLATSTEVLSVPATGWGLSAVFVAGLGALLDFSPWASFM